MVCGGRNGWGFDKESEMMDKDTYIAQLEEINKALVERLTWSQKRNMLRHNETSIKWRNKAFHYKRKCRKYEELLRKRDRI